jgi:outer membrane protein assembly factor BamB
MLRSMGKSTARGRFATEKIAAADAHGWYNVCSLYGQMNVIVRHAAASASVGTFVFALAATPAATADREWSRFRGPNGSGTVETGALPAEFGPAQNVLWKTPLPPGHSSPILAKDRILITALDGETLVTFSLDRATGRVMWRREAPRPRILKIDKRNHPASPSPATDGSNVYVFFQDFGLLAYDRDGRERWRMALGPFDNVYGMGSSPIVVDNQVVLVCDQSNGSFMIALDKNTGRVHWKVERPEAKTGHSTPIVYKPDNGAAQLLVPGSFYLTAYSLDKGEKIWWVHGLAFEMKATPVVGDGVVYIHGTSTSNFQDSYGNQIPSFDAVRSSDKDGDGRFSRPEIPDDLARRWMSLMDLNGDGYLDEREWEYYRAARASKGGMWAFRLGGRGDMTKTNTLWHYDRSVPQLPSPLLYQGTLYIVNDGGIATTLDPATGAVRAQGRLKGVIDNFWASPVGSDGKVFMISDSCKVAVLKADASLEPVAVNDLDDQCSATPAIADGKIYIRTRTALYAFGLPGSRTASR